MNTMLAGLCNLCDDFGHSNFESMQLLLDDLKKDGLLHAAAHSEFVSKHKTVPKVSEGGISQRGKQKYSTILVLFEKSHRRMTSHDGKANRYK